MEFFQKFIHRVCLPDTFLKRHSRVLSNCNREVSAEANQILSEAGCSLIFTPNEYYASGRTPLVIDCRTVVWNNLCCSI